MDFLLMTHASSLEDWAKKGKFESLEELKAEIIRIMKSAIIDPTNSDRDLQKTFSTDSQFLHICDKYGQAGKVNS